MLDPRQYRFEPFLLQPAARRLLRDGTPVALTPKLFDLLHFLVMNHGRVIEKDEIFKALWPDAFVEENNLTVNIAMLRKALGERAGQTRLIETVPKRGYRFSAAVTEVLPEPAPAPATVPDPQPAPPARATHRWAWAAGAVAALATFVFILFTLRQPPPLKAVPLPGAEATDTEPSLSPDGNQIAFVRREMGTPEVHLRILGASNAVRLTRAGAPSHAPEWSPDGKWIAFHRGPDEQSLQSVMIVPSIGGPERSIGELVTHFGVHKLSWLPSGDWVLSSAMQKDTGVYSIEAFPVKGNTRRRLSNPPTTAVGDFSPAASPDGRFLAYTRCITMSACHIVLQPMSGEQPDGPPTELPSEPMFTPVIAWNADSSELIVSGGDWAVGQLYRIPIRLHRFPGQIIPLAGAGELGSWPSIALVGRTNSQRMIYTRDLYDRNLWKFDLQTGVKAAVASTRRVEQCPRLSPRGDRIAFGSTRSGSWEIWNCDIGGNNCTQVTDFGRGLCLWVNWSPDGKMLAFDSRRHGQPDIFVVASEGGPARRLTSSTFAEVGPVWSLDGRWIYYGSNRTGRYEIWRMAPEGGQEVQVTRNGGQLPQFSPDGKWLYYVRSFAPGLLRMRLDTGVEERVAGAEDASTVHAFKVTAKGVYFVAANQGWQIRRLDFASGTVRIINTTTQDPVMGLDVDTAETALYYGWDDRSEHELMVVENFH